MNDQLNQLSIQFGSFGFDKQSSDVAMELSVEQKEWIRQQWWNNYCEQVSLQDNKHLVLSW